MRVLLVEDSPGDVRLTMEAFRTTKARIKANAYLVKPVQLEAFESLVQSINDFRVRQVQLPHGPAR